MGMRQKNGPASSMPKKPILDETGERCEGCPESRLPLKRKK